MSFPVSMVRIITGRWRGFMWDSIDPSISKILKKLLIPHYIFLIFAKNIELMSHLPKFLNTCLFTSSLVLGVICFNRALYFYYMLTPFSIFLYASSFSPLNIGCIRSSGSRKSKNECTPFGIIFRGCDDNSLFSHLDHSSKWSSNYWHSGT